MKIKIVADSSSDMHLVNDENFELVPFKIVNSSELPTTYRSGGFKFRVFNSN
jgi:hypothetical protein